jgi:hypothetical protein
VSPPWGLIVIGQHIDHPRKPYQTIMTSLLVDQEGDEIETLNSRYTLVK